MTFTCEARAFGDRMVCGRCSLSWPAKGAEPPVCKDAADPPIGLESIRAVLEAAAEDIEARQRALVELREQALAAGNEADLARSLRNVPHMHELHKAAVLRAGGRLVERIQTDATIKERLKKGSQQ